MSRMAAGRARAVGGRKCTMESTPQENAALVRRFLTDVVAGGDIDAVPIFLTEDAVDHDLVFGASRRWEAVTDLGWRALVGTTVSVDDVVATDDRVAVRATVTGTHRESLLAPTPTGESFEIACAWFCRIDDGRIAEIWTLPDALGLVQQLDAIPELPSNRSLSQPSDHQ